jgi:hypothetical protein
MAETNGWLSEDSVERTKMLGREMEGFLKRREAAKLVDANAKVRPHRELLALIAAVKSEHSGE